MKIEGVIEVVTRLLREKIILGELPGGSRLNEIELSTNLGVSRPPLRESFRNLENEKLALRIPRRGTFVTCISIEDCEQIYYTRKVIESAAIEQIIEKRVEDLSRIMLALEKTKQYKVPESMTSTDLLDYLRVMNDFHTAIIETSGNSWLISCYRTINSSLIRYGVIYLTKPESQDLSRHDHSLIVRNIEKGNAEEAKRAVEFHIDRVLDILRNMRILEEKNRILQLA